MSDPQFNALFGQVQSITAQIQAESSARVVADELLAKRVGSLESTLTGNIQSANYVPGVSGWSFNNFTGEYEINSCTLGSAAQSPERQMVSVEVASWSKWDLPKNAANLLQFMQAELQKVPEQYRHAAEFEEFDAGYGDESFNARLFLSYSRLETEQELADRLEKAKVAGTHVSIKNGLLVVSHDGVVRYKIGNLDQPEPEQAEPFKVDGDKTFIDKALIEEGTVKNFLVQADRFGVEDRSASGILREIAGMIDETKLGQDLKEQADLLESSLADQVKAVIRKELIPGGLLHRSS